MGHTPHGDWTNRPRPPQAGPFLTPQPCGGGAAWPLRWQGCREEVQEGTSKCPGQGWDWAGEEGSQEMSEK